jgi:hypothetical protein
MTKISCGYSQKMTLFEMAKCPEQVIEGLCLCRLERKRGIESSEGILVFQVVIAQKPFFVFGVVAQENTEVLRAFAGILNLRHAVHR